MTIKVTPNVIYPDGHRIQRIREKKDCGRTDCKHSENYALPTDPSTRALSEAINTGDGTVEGDSSQDGQMRHIHFLKCLRNLCCTC